MIRLIVLGLIAVLLAWPAAGVCIDDPDHCFPDSPVSPVGQVYRVWLPVVAN